MRLNYAGINIIYFPLFSRLFVFHGNGKNFICIESLTPEVPNIGHEKFWRLLNVSFFDMLIVPRFEIMKSVQMCFQTETRFFLAFHRFGTIFTSREIEKPYIYYQDNTIPNDFLPTDFLKMYCK